MTTFPTAERVEILSADERHAACQVGARYPSRALSRLRNLPDGSCALQLLEDDVILIGAEENRAQVARILGELAGLGIAALVARAERSLAQPLAAGGIIAADPDLQRVLDLNRRFHCLFEAEATRGPGKLQIRLHIQLG